MKLRIGIIAPREAPLHSGNRVTAARWRRVLSELGHEAHVRFGDAAERFDMLVVLHARKGAEAARAFRERYPEKPLVVALTGTDIYGEVDSAREVHRTLERADYLIALQPTALERLRPQLRAKAHVIYQSVAPL
ncbi:MAG: hypothetical protein M3R44_08155 [Candidatus Eremiobacteraeota bacterium]|nr:hypothetical protein [Candidatus Eremiobacteraeota bacterium]